MSWSCDAVRRCPAVREAKSEIRRLKAELKQLNDAVDASVHDLETGEDPMFDEGDQDVLDFGDAAAGVLELA